MKLTPHVQACEHCNGTGWIRCTCSASVEAVVGAQEPGKTLHQKWSEWALNHPNCAIGVGDVPSGEGERDG